MSNSALRSVAATFVTMASLQMMMRPAFADWHAGTVNGIHIGYDGSTITFSLSGWVRSNCTCYSSWPTIWV